MKKYPYIGEHATLPIINLFTRKGFFMRLDEPESFDGKEYPHNSDELLFSDITKKYLQNTWGVVESKKHAEYIIEVAELHGISVKGRKIEMVNFFSITPDGVLFFWGDEDEVDPSRNKITIPLPPKPSVSKVNRDIERDIAPTSTPEEDFEMRQIEKNNGDNLLFGDADKCKESPCVGDEVVFKHVKWKVAAKHNHMLMLVTLDDCGFALAGKNDCEKPKTPEEELRDDIIQTIHDDVYKGTYAKGSLEVFADALIGKYNITKKPQ